MSREIGKFPRRDLTRYTPPTEIRYLHCWPLYTHADFGLVFYYLVILYSEFTNLQVKTLIVDLMLKSPGPVQKQLSQAIAIIGQQDFPMNWQNLVTDLVAKFATGDFHVINGVLQTAHSIFEKYAIEFKSQKLWEEIKFVLDRWIQLLNIFPLQIRLYRFAAPLTELFVQTISLAQQHAGNKDALKVIPTCSPR